MATRVDGERPEKGCKTEWDEHSSTHRGAHPFYLFVFLSLSTVVAIFTSINPICAWKPWLMYDWELRCDLSGDDCFTLTAHRFELNTWCWQRKRLAHDRWLKLFNCTSDNDQAEDGCSLVPKWGQRAIVTSTVITLRGVHSHLKICDTVVMLLAHTRRAIRGVHRG